MTITQCPTSGRRVRGLTKFKCGACGTSVEYGVKVRHGASLRTSQPALGDAIARRSEESAGRFDLQEAMTRQDELLATVRKLGSMLGGHEGPELDRAMLAVLRPVYRVLYDPIDPFHPDPGFSLGPLPGLAPLTILAEEDPSSARYLFAETTLVRERNRLMEALDESLARAERLRAMVGS